MILNTKIEVPQLAENLIARDHLVNRISEGISEGSHLTLVVASAGFGKTTLVSQWVGQQEALVAWYALDDSDNEELSFLTYLLTTLQHVHEEIGETALALTQSSQKPSTKIVLTSLINDLSESSQPIILVLDDYHLITKNAVHDLMMFLLEHAPTQLHIIMTTRIPPPIPLARLRARKLLTDISAEHLRFAHQDIEQYFETIFDLQLSADIVKALESRTSGWVTGLQLIGITLPDTSSQDDFFDALFADNQYIFDYLIEEVLQHLPEDVQQFLLKTSILERLHPDLCLAITGFAETNRLLASFERSNLFIRRVGDWFQYHHLFSDVLQKHLIEQSVSEELATLHKHAGEWHMKEGLLQPAIRHFLASKNYTQIVNFLELHGDDLSRKGAFEFLEHTITSIPESLFKNHPKLLLLLGRVYGARLDVQRSRQSVDSAMAALSKHPDAVIEAQCYASTGTWLRVRGQVAESMQMFERSQELASDLKPTFWDDPNQGIALNYFNMGKLKQAEAAARRSELINQQIDNFIMLMYIRFLLAEIQIDAGELFQAEQTYFHTMGLAERHGKLGAIEVGVIYGGYASLLWEWNRLDEAFQYATRGYEIGKPLGTGNNLLYNAISLYRIYLSRGAWQDAQNVLEDAQAIIHQSNNPLWIRGFSAYRARFDLWCWRQQGQSAETTSHLNQWYQSLPFKDGTWDHVGTNLLMPDHGHDFVHLTLARYFIALSKYDQANDLLTWLLNRARQQQRYRSMVETLMLQALTVYQMDQPEKSIGYLSEALELAAPRGLRRMFLDEGKPMVKALQCLPSDHTAHSFATELLEAAYLEQADNTIVKQQGLIEALSPRELEILALVANGMTNQSIADQLFISIGTVKRHVSNIHGKLGVENRTQAVARARVLNLLID